MAIRERIKHLLASDCNPTKITVEAAYRYLVRSHEILETAHGSFHPAVATGCLAVASVQNILEVCCYYYHYYDYCYYSSFTTVVIIVIIIILNTVVIISIILTASTSFPRAMKRVENGW